MNLELEKLRKEMTREEFIKKIRTDHGTGCPKKWGLSDIDLCMNGECIDCWKLAVKDIHFKDDIEAMLEVLTDGKKEELSTIKDSGYRTEFPSGAVRDLQENKGRMDLLPWAAIIEVSKHCQEGAKKYGEGNINLGIPIHSLIDSGLRHLAKYVEGEKDEKHLLASAWNILWAIQFELTKPELQDIPSRLKND
jgi:hypothetical protein